MLIPVFTRNDIIIVSVSVTVTPTKPLHGSLRTCRIDVYSTRLSYVFFFCLFFFCSIICLEVVVQKCSIKKLFLKILQNS